MAAVVVELRMLDDGWLEFGTCWLFEELSASEWWKRGSLGKTVEQSCNS